MDKTTRHDRKKFINELEARWQKKFRNMKKWLNDEDLGDIDSMLEPRKSQSRMDKDDAATTRLDRPIELK